jgi:hypothetical protein
VVAGSPVTVELAAADPYRKEQNVDRESTEASKARASRPVQQIAVQDFTQAAFEGVLRAVEARNVEERQPFGRLPYGPIIYGIIWDPDFQTGEVFGPRSGAAER